jgi:geranylgeranyl diphosphate synthase, type II
MADILAYLKKVAQITDSLLENLLQKDSVYPPSIHSVMRYSTFAGGKRVRPALIMAVYEACGGRFGDNKTLLACAAIEMLHTFSLMHDDLPCMDDDDFRRGKPTAHKAFNEALAVLGGDGLCIFAFEVLTRIGRIDIISEIAQALGTKGMIGGQVVDIESEGKKVDIKTVEYIHSNKTAALITASVRTGALLANVSEKKLAQLTRFGNHIGLAFQIVDDILDEEGTTEQLGKDAGSDRESGKATFPAVIGMTESKRRATDLVKKSIADVAFLKEKGAMLSALAEFIGSRAF